MQNQAKYQLLKNLQQSLLSIAGELKQIKSLTRQEQYVTLAQNSGRLEGLAQGLDFHTESYNQQENNETRVFGFRPEELPTDVPE